MSRRDLYIAERLAERRPVTHATATQSDYGKGYDYGRSAEWEAIVEHFAADMGESRAADFRKACGYGEDKI